ncbi:extracellular solute-binding protein [bacterium]|nr:MAG: extracellular solute-binding protein [bacterium]
MFKRIEWVTCEVLIIACIVLSACSQATPATEAPAAGSATEAVTVESTSASSISTASGEAVTLTLGSWRTDDAEAIQPILDKFHAAFPNITINFSPTLPTEYDAAITTQLTSGTGDDLYYLRSKGSGAAHKLYEAGYFVPIDDLPGLDNMPQDVIDSWTGTDGHIFGVGIYKNSMGLFYNADIFRQLDLPLPTTWEELLTTAQKIKDAGVTPFANGYGEPAYVRSLFLWNWIPMVIGGKDGRTAYFDGDACLNDANWVQLFKMVTDVTPYLPNGAAALTNSDAREYFIQGKAAMFFNGSYDIPIIQAGNPEFEWSIMAIPPLEGKDNYMVAELDAAIGINSASEHIPEAKLFLSWLTTRDFAAMVPDSLVGNFPVTKDTDITTSNPYSQKFLDLMAAAKGTDARFYMNTGTPGTSSLFVDLTVTVLNGTMTPEQAAQSLYDGISSWSGEQKACKK